MCHIFGMLWLVSGELVPQAPLIAHMIFHHFALQALIIDKKHMDTDFLCTTFIRF